MRFTIRKNSKLTTLILLFVFVWDAANAQTDADGIMMKKNNFCSGIMYGYSSWKNYWEGTNKRDNANLGTVSTRMLGLMGNYGVTSKLNLLFGIPYIKTKASAGQLHGMNGLQDLSLWIKYIPFERNIGGGVISVYTIAGFSFPVSDYNPDFLPLAIGLHSKSLSLRGMIDYQTGNWFATVSGTFVLRDNIKIFRTSYYTTEMHYSNEVNMPNATQLNLRAGFRSDDLIAEALLSNWTTQGGYDITKNNMPFPSNKMNMTTVGINLKYNVNALDGLSLIGGGNVTVTGRNVGQATTYNGGLFYILDCSKKIKISSNNKKS